MPRERLKSPRARLFAALDLPEDLRAGIVEWGRRELTDPAIRPIRPESLHVTLCFIGYIAEKRVDEAAALVTGRKATAVPLLPAASPVGKPRSRPRFYALDLTAPAAVELQAELEDELVAAGLCRREKRAFWPHVTVAKVRPERGTRRPRRVGRAPDDLPAELVRTFESVRLSLYRSNLRPEGAQYASLASLNLPPERDASGRERR